MKTIRFILISAVFASISLSGTGLSAQSVINLGKTKVELQSPLKIKKEDDRLYSEPQVINYGEKGEKKKKWHKYEYTTMIVGFGFPIRTEQGTMPIFYGNSYYLDLGLRQIWRVASHYSLTASAKYTFYNYRTFGITESGKIISIPEEYDIKKEFFRTDNLGADLGNRIYLNTSGTDIFIDFGVYGEWAFSRRMKVKSTLNGNRQKNKMKDGNLFCPLQGGVYGGIGIGSFIITGKYKLTNSFNHDRYAMEPDRLSLGVTLEF